MYIEPTIRKQRRIEVNDRIDALCQDGNRLQHGIFGYGWPSGRAKVRRCVSPDGTVLVGWTTQPEDDFLLDLPDVSVHLLNY